MSDCVECVAFTPARLHEHTTPYARAHTSPRARLSARALAHRHRATSVNSHTSRTRGGRPALLMCPPESQGIPRVNPGGPRKLRKNNCLSLVGASRLGSACAFFAALRMQRPLLQLVVRLTP